MPSQRPVGVAAGMCSLWARRRKIDLAELVSEPWILSPPGTWTYTCVAEGFPSTRATYATDRLRDFFNAHPLVCSFQKQVRNGDPKLAR
jgi:hypothetical protein